MSDFLRSAWFHRFATVAAAAGIYVLASKFPAFAKELAALAMLLPSGVLAKGNDDT